MPTEPAPYQPTVADIERRDVADIERRDDAERKQRDAYLDELRTVAQKARAEGRDRERERVIRILEARLDPKHADYYARFAVAEILAAVRSGEEPGR